MMRGPRAGVALTALLLAALAADAHAGASIGDPRRPNSHFDVSDSTAVKRAEFGILFGTPSAFNLEVGWWPQPRWGVRASGLFLGENLHGIQGNFCWTLARSLRRREAVAVIGGSIGSNFEAWNYGGVAFDWNLAPLFAEVGFVAGHGSLAFFGDAKVPSSAILVQVGLMGGGGVLGPR